MDKKTFRYLVKLDSIHGITRFVTIAAMILVGISLVVLLMYGVGLFAFILVVVVLIETLGLLLALIISDSESMD